MPCFLIIRACKTCPIAGKRLRDIAGMAVLADIRFGSRLAGEGQRIFFSFAASNEAKNKGVAYMADFIRANAKAKKTA